MKRVYVNEDWCLACHLCEYNCAFANSGMKDMATALKGKPIYPRIHVEGDDKISYAVSCRHCTNPICVKSCIAGAISMQGTASFALIKINVSVASPACWCAPMARYPPVKTA